MSGVALGIIEVDYVAEGAVALGAVAKISAE